MKHADDALWSSVSSLDPCSRLGVMIVSAASSNNLRAGTAGTSDRRGAIAVADRGSGGAVQHRLMLVR